MMSPKSGASETRPRVGLSPTRPHADAGMRIEPPPSLAWADRHHARGDRGRRAAARAAGRARRGPTGCASAPKASGLGGRRGCPARGCWSCPRKTKPALAEARRELGVVVLDPADVAQEAACPRTAGRRPSAPPRSFSRNGTPRKGPSGSSPAAAARALSNSGVITALSSRVEALDALDRLVDQLARACLPAADQLRLGRGVRDRTGHAAKLTQVEGPQGLAHPALAAVQVPAVAMLEPANASSLVSAANTAAASSGSTLSRSAPISRERLAAWASPPSWRLRPSARRPRPPRRSARRLRARRPSRRSSPSPSGGSGPPAPASRRGPRWPAAAPPAPARRSRGRSGRRARDQAGLPPKLP